MSEVSTIKNTEMQIVEHEGIRVITTRQVAEAYGTTPKRVSNNFTAHKDRFTEGKHYFRLSGQDKADFLNRPEIEDSYSDRPEIRDSSKKAKFLYLWTERGALLLAKSINTDIAWQAYERLVDFYFEVKEDFNPPIERFPEEKPRITYQTSSTPVPKNPSWQARNRRRINALCEKANTSVSNLYHHVLLRLGEEYNLNAANRIYEEEVGHVPKYAMDIVSYFPELARMADAYLDKIEEVTEKELNKR